MYSENQLVPGIEQKWGMSEWWKKIDNISGRWMDKSNLQPKPLTAIPKAQSSVG